MTATVNWNSVAGKNIEIDLLQENRNKDVKKIIKGMDAKKTEKAIINGSRAAGGQQKLIEDFDRAASLALGILLL